MSMRLRLPLEALGSDKALKGPVVKAQGGRGVGAQTVVNWFFKLNLELGFYGCSSHSGRLTAITRWARKISAAGGSMRDVQILDRHSSLAMTQGYIKVGEHTIKRSLRDECLRFIFSYKRAYPNHQQVLDYAALDIAKENCVEGCFLGTWN